MKQMLEHGVAGGLAGISVDAVFYPLQTIKTRIMASSQAQPFHKLASTNFKGFSCQMIVSFPYSFSFFYTYELVRNTISQKDNTKGNNKIDGHHHHHHHHNQWVYNSAASVCAQLVGNLVRNPFEVIKQQMMVGRADQILHSFTNIIRSRGILGLYTGLKPTLARDILFSAVQLPIFQEIRHQIHLRYGASEVVSAALGGMVAACIAGFVSCPLDVIKTRHMTQQISINVQKYTSAQIVKDIYKEYGLKGFFRGVAFRCGILTFGGAIYFAALQYFRGIMQLGHNRKSGKEA